MRPFEAVAKKLGTDVQQCLATGFFEYDSFPAWLAFVLFLLGTCLFRLWLARRAGSCSCRRLRFERNGGTTSTRSCFEEDFMCLPFMPMPALRSSEPLRTKSASTWKVCILHLLHWPSDWHTGTKSVRRVACPKRCNEVCCKPAVTPSSVDSSAAGSTSRSCCSCNKFQGTSSPA